MPRNKGSRLGSEPDRPPFLTIDDCVQRAQELAAGLQNLTKCKYPLDIRRGLRKEVKDDMNHDQPSKQIKGSGRTYFLDVEKTREGKAYLKITESRKGKGDTFERNSIHVFPEDAETFAHAVSEMIGKLG